MGFEEQFGVHQLCQQAQEKPVKTGSRAGTSSLLIITWDEHGGFHDHAIPPDAVAPGDTGPDSSHNKNGFTFEKYAPRVPALVISPLIPENLSITDAPAVLPPVASAEAAPLAAAMADAAAPISVSRPEDSADEGNLPRIVQVALRQDLTASPAAEHAAIIARVRSIKKRSEGTAILNEYVTT